MKKVLNLLFLTVLTLSCTQQGAWDLLRGQALIAQMLSNYDHRVKVTIDNTGQNESFTDFPVLVVMKSDRFTYANISSDGSGIKFITGDLSKELSYEMESWNPGGDSFFWVKIPLVPAGSDAGYFWIYYSTESDAKTVTSSDVWNSDYLAVWHMNNSSVTIKDSGPLELNGIAGYGTQGQPSLDTGRIAKAQVFNGTGEGITVTPSAPLDNMGPVTISFWMRDQGAADWSKILEKGGVLCQLRKPSTNNIRFSVEYDTPSKIRSRYDNVWPENVWTFFSVTWDGTENHNAINIYADGTLLPPPVSFSDGTLPRLTDAGFDLTIGSDASGGDSFKGKIDEMRIADVVRSPAWIKAQYLSMTDSFLIYGHEEEVSK